ncbi:MAG: hypothetical protein M1814_006898 [Vezdaea aestivalis]|nr:MAG: hypothetical protein M1814_006898 [Vezdaea aestivalis]
MPAPDLNPDPIDWSFNEALKVNAENIGPFKKKSDGNPETTLGDFSRLWNYLGIASESSPDTKKNQTSVVVEHAVASDEYDFDFTLALETKSNRTKKKVAQGDAISRPDKCHNEKKGDVKGLLSKQDTTSQDRKKIIQHFLNITQTTPARASKRPNAERSEGVRFKSDDEGMTSKDEGLAKALLATNKKAASRPNKVPQSAWIFQPEKDGSSRLHSGYGFEDLNDVFKVKSKAQLIDQLLSDFPKDSTSLKAVTGPTRFSIFAPRAHQPQIFVFIDISNIKISLQHRLKRNRELDEQTRISAKNLQFYSLSLILERGRNAARRCLVGSRPLRELKEAESCKYECKLLERVDKPYDPTISSGRGNTSGSDHATHRRRGEQAVDELLNMCMLESLLDHEPATLVLASGDAAVGEFSAGFLRTVERALERGWQVEVASFASHTSNAYFRAMFRERWKKRFQFIDLEPYAELLAAK